MNKKTVAIMVAIGVGFLALVGVSRWQDAQEDAPVTYERYEYAGIKKLAKRNDNKGYFVESEKGVESEFGEILPKNDQSGGLEENVEGNAESKVLIFEYADYQCEACAAMNSLVNKIVEEYGDRVGVVFRTYVLSYHRHGVRVASAANAAAIQGYWKEYKDLLFGNQALWTGSEPDQLQRQLEEYFKQASGGKGDMIKFRQDMKSEAVAKKVAFDVAIGEKMKLEGTPTFYVGEELISAKTYNYKTQDEFVRAIKKELDKRLAELAKK